VENHHQRPLLLLFWPATASLVSPLLGKQQQQCNHAHPPRHEQVAPLLSAKCSRLCLNRELYQLRTPSARLNVPKVSVYRGSSRAQSHTVCVPILLLFFMLRVMLVTTTTAMSEIVVMTASSKEMSFFTASPWHGLATFRHQPRTSLTMSKSLMCVFISELESFVSRLACSFVSSSSLVH
jgi:hypothetical protein